MQCNWCGQRPPASRAAIYCDNETCIRERARWRKVRQRDRDLFARIEWPRRPRPEHDVRRDRERPEGDLHLGHRARTWTTGGQSGAVLTLEGTEMPPMTGDNTLRCRCGLELRAHTERELDELRARHKGEVCIVIHKASHWSVIRMQEQRKQQRPMPVLEPESKPGKVPDPIEATGSEQVTNR